MGHARNTTGHGAVHRNTVGELDSTGHTGTQQALTGHTRTQDIMGCVSDASGTSDVGAGAAPWGAQDNVVDLAAPQLVSGKA